MTINEQNAQPTSTGIAIGSPTELIILACKSNALPWGLIDNRPYLRCLHGKGLCLWRLGKTQEAAAVFHKQLWLNPSDNQGARFNLAAVEDGKTWDEMETAGW
jgi:hypothetical protein